ncbi:MAG: RNA-binding S4 domain-containing protein [Opitutales bacterium]
MTFGNQNSEEIFLKKLPIELHALLKFTNVVQSGGEAKQVIAQARVSVNNSLTTQKGKKIIAGDIVKVFDKTLLIRAQES